MGSFTPEIRKRIVKAHKKGSALQTSLLSFVSAIEWYGNERNEHIAKEKIAIEVTHNDHITFTRKSSLESRTPSLYCMTRSTGELTVSP